MEDILRKSKRRPSLAHKQYPAAYGPFQAPPRAIVPDSAPPSSPRSAHAATPTPPVPTTAAAHVRPTRAPRKRFRKKVTGLFGDQTDLHKRMQKLLRPLTDDLLNKKKHRLSDTSPPQVNIELEQVTGAGDTLHLAKEVVHEMDKKVPASSAELGEQLAGREATSSALPIKSSMSNRALASIAKWRRFSNRIGRMSPRSNELFLNEVEVCTPSSDLLRCKDRLDPPSLPALDNSSSPVLSYICDDTGARIGAPATLRRKVRRNERGYRGADVVRMRSSRSGDGCEAGGWTCSRGDPISPAAHRRSGESGTGLDVYVRSLENADVIVTRRAHSEMGEQEREVISPRAMSDMTDGRRSAPKRRRTSDESETSDGEKHQTSALSLLIEAVEKETGQPRVREATTDDLPPRKAKRLRSSGVTGIASPTEEKRRHTSLGVNSRDEEVEQVLPPITRLRRVGDVRIMTEKEGYRRRGVGRDAVQEESEIDSAATADEGSDEE